MISWVMVVGSVGFESSWFSLCHAVGAKPVCYRCDAYERWLVFGYRCDSYELVALDYRG
jgi:hypothetical protein